MGLIRAGWHLPLMVSGAIPWFDVLFFSMAFQFLISWLFNRTGESVLIPMLFHLTSNVVGGGIVLPLFTGIDHDRYYLLFVIVAWLPALVLKLEHGPSRAIYLSGVSGVRPHNSMEPTRPAEGLDFMRYWSWLAGRLISEPLTGANDVGGR
jgi:lipid-A-disaccharide synthase-like uncharacterized protein